MPAGHRLVRYRIEDGTFDPSCNMCAPADAQAVAAATSVSTIKVARQYYEHTRDERTVIFCDPDPDLNF